MVPFRPYHARRLHAYFPLPTCPGTKKPLGSTLLPAAVCHLSKLRFCPRFHCSPPANQPKNDIANLDYPAITVKDLLVLHIVPESSSGIFWPSSIDSQNPWVSAAGTVPHPLHHLLCGEDYCNFPLSVRSHMVPFQFWMYPLSPQIGHHHSISSASGSRSTSMRPSQGFRPGRRRQRTRYLGGATGSGCEPMATIEVKNSASRRAGPLAGAMRPSSSRK